MRLKHLHIDRFGVWSELDLTLGESNIDVFYGPNEAGKTTLLRFIRGMLYGFQLTSADRATLADRSQPAWSGTLTLEHDGRTLTICRRIDDQHPEGRLSFEGVDHQTGTTVLQQLHQDLDRETFEQVFAVGLPDIQELSTLNESDAAEFLYNLSLDSDARHLIAAQQDLQERQQHLWGPDGSAERLEELKRQRAEIIEELQSTEDRRDQFHDLDEQRRNLQGLIEDMRSRQASLARELKGHEFLQRVWKPWHRVRELQAELTALPASDRLPEDAEGQLAGLDEEIEAARQCRDALRREAEDFRTTASRVAIDERLLRHADIVRGFVAQQDWIVDLQQLIEQAQSQSENHRKQLDGHLQALGPDWTSDRLERTRVSPETSQRLLEMGQNYRSTRWRKRRLDQRWKSLCRRLKAQADRLRQALQNSRVTDLDEALNEARQQQQDLQTLGQVRLNLDYVEQRRGFLERQKREQQHPGHLPGWFHGVMTAFLVTGILLIGIGIYNAYAISGIAGAIFVLLGLTWLGIRVGLKQHYTENNAPADDEIRTELISCQQEHKRLRQSESELLTRCSHLIDRDDSVPFADRLSAAASHCLEQRLQLEELVALQERLSERREQLARLKAARQTARRDLATSRENWRKSLAAAGLSSNLRLRRALAIWQQIVTAAHAHDRWQQSLHELRSLQKIDVSFQQRLQQLVQKLGRPQLQGIPTLKILDLLGHDLDELDRLQDVRQQAQSDEQQRRQEMQEYEHMLQDLQQQCRALFARCGANTREDFEQFLLSRMRYQEVQELLEEARLELEDVAQSEPELAIVEDDLLQFDRHHCQETIDTLSGEISDLDDDLQSSHERLGSITQELSQLGDNRRVAELKLHRNQIEAELAEVSEECCALRLAEQCLDELRSQYERSRQPETLRQASRFLAQLTRGRYDSVWSPLGSRQLLVTDDHDQTFEVEQLSGGTREQLFLALRLALIEQYAELGLRLPVVLDDLLVNFDQLRSEGAVETLLEFCSEQQQLLLFTCHLHLAHLFESRGHEPTWLPGHHSRIEERRAG